MGRRQNRKTQGCSVATVETENVKQVHGKHGPALKWLTYGQVVYADIPWGPMPGESKRRPSMYVGEESRNEAIVRPMYSNPRTGADIVTYRGKRSYLGYEIVVDRMDISAVSSATVEPKDDPLAIGGASWE